jgi:hypothetical protein
MFRCGPCPGGFLRDDEGNCLLPRVANTTSVANTATVRPEATVELTLSDGFDAVAQQQELIDEAVSHLVAALQLIPSDIVVELADGSLRRL